MTTFDELVGAEPTGDDRARLRSVHALLIEAGPPAEVPPEFASGPTFAMTLGRARRVRSRSRRMLIPALAAAALVALVIAISTGGRGRPVLALKLKGSAAAPLATGTLEVLKPTAKNSPMRIDVKLLRAGPYAVWLVRNGRPVAECGEFRVKAGANETVAKLTSPYKLEAHDSWIVTRPDGSDGPGVTMLQPTFT